MATAYTALPGLLRLLPDSLFCVLRCTAVPVHRTAPLRRAHMLCMR